MKDRVIIVEDSEEIRGILQLYLEGHDFSVDTAVNGLEGLKKISTQEYDLALVDIMMPEMDGYKLIKRVREISDMPMMIISAKKEDNDKIIGLNIGADDYITKPFNPLEVVARVNAVIRRFKKASSTGSGEGNSIGHKELELHSDTCKVFKSGEEIQLTATEYKILSLFMRNPERIFSKRKISEHLNGEYYESDDNAITVHISHIRDKVGVDSENKQYIKTVKGLGYKLEK